MFFEPADDFRAKNEDLVELALNRSALTLVLRRDAEETGDEFADAWRQSDEQVGYGGGLHAFAETRAVVLILPVEVFRSFRELANERIVQALQTLGLMKVFVAKAGDAENQTLFFVSVPRGGGKPSWAPSPFPTPAARTCRSRA